MGLFSGIGKALGSVASSVGSMFGSGWAGPALSAGLSFLGGDRANVSSARMSEQQMQFQKMMSDTAHQREVKDLRKAGLNPILSGTGGSGASSPAGSMAMQQDAITPAVQSALATRRQAQELKVMTSQEKLNNQQENTEKYRQYQLDSSSALNAHNAALMDSQTAINREAANTERERAAYVRAQTVKELNQAGLLSHSARSSKVTADLDEQFRKVERLIEMGEGATSAVRNLIPIPGRRR